MKLSFAALLFCGALYGCSFHPTPTADPRGVVVANDSTATAGTGKKIASGALQLLGVPYRYGGDSPEGFDCSGLVQYVHAQAGITIPRTTREQLTQAQSVDELQAGDVVFFSVGGRIAHNGIYLGRGRLIHAPSSGKQVSVVRLDNPWFKKRFVAAKRFYASP